jgi:hypothetical protein
MHTYIYCRHCRLYIINVGWGERVVHYSGFIIRLLWNNAQYLMCLFFVLALFLVSISTTCFNI